MNNINEVKEEIKRIQKNFNPEKATYKILNDILTEEYTEEEIIEYMKKIKGVEKYPEELQKDFLNILVSLKKISKAKEEKEKQEEKDKKEENTRELKAIIDALEDKEKSVKEEVKEEIKEEVKEEPEEDEEELETLDEEEKVSDNTLPVKIFKVVLVIVILCVLLAIGLVLFY